MPHVSMALKRRKTFLEGVQRQQRNKKRKVATKYELEPQGASPDEGLEYEPPRASLNHLPRVALVLLWALTLAGAPVVLGQLVWSLASTPGVNLDQDIDYVEYFAGRREITNAMRQHGYVAIAYELNDDPIFCDWCSDLGFATALQLAAKLKCGGGAHAAIVCSSFVGINAGTSGRSRGNPMGRRWQPSVAMGNLMASRLALLLILLSALGYWWTVENPRGSFLELHDRLQDLIGNVNTWRIFVRYW